MIASYRPLRSTYTADYTDTTVEVFYTTRAILVRRSSVTGTIHIPALYKPPIDPKEWEVHYHFEPLGTPPLLPAVQPLSHVRPLFKKRVCAGSSRYRVRM